MNNEIKEILDKTNINVLDEINVLEYIDELENKINKAIEYINYSLNNQLCDEREALKYTLDILRGEDNGDNK